MKRESKDKFECKVQNERASITILVSIAIIFLMVVVLNVYSNIRLKVSTQEKETDEIEAEYRVNNSQLDEAYEKLVAGNLENIAIPGEIVTGGNATYTDGTDTAIIPEGFAVVTDPDSINNGLVISDKPEDNMNNDTKGNQFLWIPVSKENFETEFVRHDFGNQNIPDTDFIDTQLTAGKWYEPSPSNTNGTTPTTKAEVIAMYKSVQTNGGFYIARFEAGNEGGIYNTETNQWEGNGKVVSKKGAVVYNNIKWGNSMTDETGGAVEKAREMYPGHSTLCYDVQWDAIMRWISKDSRYSMYLKNSTGIGNYETSMVTSPGSNPTYQTKNIYDLAGNVAEWSMGAYELDIRIDRGASSLNPGYSYPMTYYNYGHHYDFISTFLRV